MTPMTEHTIYKCIHIKELLEATQNGWEFIPDSGFDQDHVEQGTRPIDKDQYGSWIYETVFSTPCKYRYCLVKKTENVDLHEKVKALQADISSLRDLSAGLLKEKEQRENENANLLKGIQEARESRDTSVAEERRLRRKLEEDLAKIHRAIGEREYNKILKEAP